MTALGRTSMLSALALTGALFGCDADSAAPAAPSAAPLEQPSPAKPAGDRVPVVKAVEWPSPARMDGTARQALTDAARRAVDRSPVPVLVPATRPWLERATVICKPDWYSLSATHDELSVVLRASRLAYRYPDIQPMQGDQRVRGLPAFVSGNDRVRRTSWTEFGVAYSLELLCSLPGDARCADETLLRDMAAALVYVGGNRRSATEAKP